MYDLTMFSREERLIFSLSKNKRLSFCEDDESIVFMKIMVSLATMNYQSPLLSGVQCFF